MKPTLQKSVKWPGCMECHYWKLTMRSRIKRVCTFPRRKASKPACGSGYVYREVE